MTLPCSSLCSRILQIKPKLPREHAFVSMKEASGICFSTTLTSWCLSPQLPGWILEGFFYLNKQTALNEDYQDYYYHDHVVVIALTLQRKHTRWTRRRWVCHPLTSVTICRYRKYLIFLVKKSPFSAKAVIVYTGYFFYVQILTGHKTNKYSACQQDKVTACEGGGVVIGGPRTHFCGCERICA